MEDSRKVEYFDGL